MSIPNERMFPHRWFREVPTLKTRDIAVWWYLSQRQGKDPFIRTSVADIASWCRLSRKSTERSIRTLIDNKMLSVESGQDHGKANQYTVLVPEWVGQYGGGSVKGGYPSIDAGVGHGDAGVRQQYPGGASTVDTGKDLGSNSSRSVEGLDDQTPSGGSSKTKAKAEECGVCGHLDDHDSCTGQFPNTKNCPICMAEKNAEHYVLIDDPEV